MRLTPNSREITAPKGTATQPSNRRRAMKHTLGLHGKRKTKYRKAGLTGGYYA